MNMAAKLDAVLCPALETRKEECLYRNRRIVEGPQGPYINLDDRRVLAFCSNDYLGLAGNPVIAEAAREALSVYGTGSGAAHLITGHTREHHALEGELAEFLQRPRALLFSTGYMANLGVATALLKRGDAIYEDRLNHASLLDAGLLSGARLQRYVHGDVAALRRKISSANGRGKLVMTDGVFSMDGDLSPLPEIAGLAADNDAWLAVDDAHGIGVIGEQGRGSLEHFHLGAEEVPILIGTLGKAFGTFGAFVAGSDALIETLIQQARTYIYTTAPPAAIATATRAALRIVQDEPERRERLQELIKYFRSGARQLDIELLESKTPIQPLLVRDAMHAMRLSEALLRQDILVTAIRPPTVPVGTARLRITLSAAHEFSQIDRLLDVLSKVLPASAA